MIRKLWLNLNFHYLYLNNHNMMVIMNYVYTIILLIYLCLVYNKRQNSTFKISKLLRSSIQCHILNYHFLMYFKIQMFRGSIHVQELSYNTVFGMYSI